MWRVNNVPYAKPNGKNMSPIKKYQNLYRLSNFNYYPLFYLLFKRKIRYSSNNTFLKIRLERVKITPQEEITALKV